MKNWYKTALIVAAAYVVWTALGHDVSWATKPAATGDYFRVR